jgi:hypothetical protein
VDHELLAMTTVFTLADPFGLAVDAEKLSPFKLKETEDGLEKNLRKSRAAWTRFSASKRPWSPYTGYNTVKGRAWARRKQFLVEELGDVKEMLRWFRAFMQGKARREKAVKINTTKAKTLAMKSKTLAMKSKTLAMNASGFAIIDAVWGNGVSKSDSDSFSNASSTDGTSSQSASKGGASKAASKAAFGGSSDVSCKAVKNRRAALGDMLKQKLGQGTKGMHKAPKHKKMAKEVSNRKLKANSMKAMKKAKAMTANVMKAM